VAQPAAVTGVQLMQGIGAPEAKGFWADAWGQIVKRAGARFALGWLSIVGLIAVLAPVLANGHPIVYRRHDASGNPVGVSYPMLENFSAGDAALLLGTIVGGLFFAGARRRTRGERLATLVICGVAAGLTIVATTAVFAAVRASDDPSTRRLASQLWAFRAPVALGFAALFGAGAFAMLPMNSRAWRLGVVAAAGLIGAASAAVWWQKPLQTFPYAEEVMADRARAVFAPVPFSPGQRDVRGDLMPPGGASGLSKERVRAGEPAPAGAARHLLGTDSLGQDVLSQMLHACRLSISIGLVSTGIAVIIGVTIGALMGYFGGWLDLLLYRVVEVFMSVPVLFLLIVAAAVLPRNTYVMMAIIGCVTWTGAARFTRAEFMRLRSQDFVQSAKAVGLPLRSILFKHMLPNGVTPVLVDASFAVAAAILAEATLSFLGLGPDDQASWGRLLADATNTAGDFIWWLAIFPGLAIFLSVLAYNLLGEAMRDAIDPKLKKARV
jgi:peptide/nickel transport system permease protein